MRKPRVIAPNLPHHLILRGNNQRKLFSYRPEYRLFLDLLGKAAKRYCVPLHAVALMSNHVHLVATPPSKEVASAFVKNFAQRYAQHRNKRRKGSGKLFEERFVSLPLDTDEALAMVTAYVDLNPVRAGLCADPAAHPWTTYCLHIGRAADARIAPALWTPSPWYLALSPTPAGRQAAYAEWVKRCLDVQPVRPRSTPEVRVRRPNGRRAT